MKKCMTYVYYRIKFCTKTHRIIEYISLWQVYHIFYYNGASLLQGSPNDGTAIRPTICGCNNYSISV